MSAEESEGWEQRIAGWTLESINARLESAGSGECFFPTCPDPAGLRPLNFFEDERQAWLCAADFMLFHDWLHDNKLPHEHDEDFPETRGA